MTVHRAPRGLGAPGKRLWSDTLKVYTLNPADLALLAEACKLVDLVSDVHDQLLTQPLTVEGHKGQPRPNPLIAQAHTLATALTRVVGQLNLPDLPDQADQRDASPPPVKRFRRHEGHAA